MSRRAPPAKTSMGTTATASAGASLSDHFWVYAVDPELLNAKVLGIERFILPGTEGQIGTWSNAGFCLFNNPNIGRTHTSLLDGAPQMVVSAFFTFSVAARTALRLEMVSACGSNTGGDPVTLEYSLDGGGSFINVYTLAAAFAKRLDTITLGIGQDVTKVQVRMSMTVSAAHNITLFAPRLIETVVSV